MIRSDYTTGTPGLKINMIPGPTNPSTGMDEYYIYDYWHCPDAFSIPFVGINPKWNDEYIRGETGALKRHMIHLIMNQINHVDLSPFSILVCIENLQRYYSEKLFELSEEIKCLKQPSTSSTGE